MKLFDVLYTNKDYDGRALISSNNANACNFILQSQGKLGNSYQITSILDVGESSFPEILISEYYSKRVDNKKSSFSIKDVYDNMEFNKFSEEQITSLKDLLNIPEVPDYTDKFEEIQESIQDLSDADVDIKKKVNTNSKSIDSIRSSVSYIQGNYSTRIQANENNIIKNSNNITTINNRLNNQDTSLGKKEVFITNKNFYSIGNPEFDDSPTLESFGDLFNPPTYIEGEWYNPFLIELDSYTNKNYTLEPAKIICRMSRFITVENLNTFSIVDIYNNKDPFNVTELDNCNQFHKMICRFAKKVEENLNNISHFYVLNIKFNNCHNGRFYHYEPLYDKDGYCIYEIHRKTTNRVIYIEGFNMNTIKDRHNFNNNQYKGFTNPNRKLIIQSNRYIWNVTDHIFEYNPYCYKNNTAIFVKKKGTISPINIYNALSEYTDKKIKIPNSKFKYSIYKFVFPYKWFFAYNKAYNLEKLSNVFNENVETLKQMFSCNEDYIPKTIKTRSLISSKEFEGKTIQTVDDSKNQPGIAISGKYTIYIGNYIAQKHHRSTQLKYQGRHMIGEPVMMLKIQGIKVVDNSNSNYRIKILKDNSVIKYL